MQETNISKVAVVLDSNDLLLVLDLPPPLIHLIDNLADRLLGFFDVLKVRVVLRRVLDNILHEQGIFTDALDGLEEEGAQAEGPALFSQGSLLQEYLEGLVLLQLVEKVHGIWLIAAVNTVHPKEACLRRQEGGIRSETCRIRGTGENKGDKTIWRKTSPILRTTPAACRSLSLLNSSWLTPMSCSMFEKRELSSWGVIIFCLARSLLKT